MNYKRQRRRNNYKCYQANDDNMPTDRQNYKCQQANNDTMPTYRQNYKVQHRHRLLQIQNWKYTFNRASLSPPLNIYNTLT